MGNFWWGICIGAGSVLLLGFGLFVLLWHERNLVDVTNQKLLIVRSKVRFPQS